MSHLFINKADRTEYCIIRQCSRDENMDQSIYDAVIYELVLYSGVLVLSSQDYGYRSRPVKARGAK